MWAGYRNLLEDYVAPVPAKGQPHPIPEGLDGLIRMEHAACNVEQKALVGLCGYAGLRIGEALNCRVNWFDVQARWLNVRGKGDKSRFVPISQRCWDACEPAFIDAMSPRMDGHLISYQDRSARKAITAMGVKAHLSRAVASHDLRATFATITYDATLDQRVVQELLGHANGSTTEVYIGRTNDQMKKAVNW